MMQHLVAALGVLDVTQGRDQRTLFVGCNPLIDQNATLSTATQIEGARFKRRPRCHSGGQ